MPALWQRNYALGEMGVMQRLRSISLNVSEANYSDPGNRRARFFTAAGSANETRAALRVAMAWRYITGADAEASLLLLDRILAMLWKLSR